MPEFAYLAQDAAGREVRGTLPAGSQRDALAALVGRSLLPVRVTPVPPPRAARRVRVPAVFYAQLADLLRAGVPLLKALEILREQTGSRPVRQLLEELCQRLADGQSLSEAMRGREDAFDATVLGIMQAGEEGGFLEESLRRVATLIDRSNELKGRIVSALAYPCILTVVGLLIVVGLLVLFVPNFQPIFERLAAQGQLPWATRLLLACSDLLRRHGLALAGGLAAVLLFLGARVETFRLRSALDRWVPRRGLGGVLLREVSTSNFCRVLGALLGNQVPLLRALRIARDAIGLDGFAAEIDAAVGRVADGGKLSDVLSGSAYVPADIAAMVAVGEQSNSLDAVLVDAANVVERRAARRLDLLLKMLEPALLVVLAAIVLFLVIGLMLPIFDASAAVE